MDEDFKAELCALLNRHSVDAKLNTPDYILARYLMGQLDVWDLTLSMTRGWHGWPTLSEKLGLER